MKEYLIKKKTLERASVSEGQQPSSRNINNIMKVMNFIQQSMALLLDHKTQLKSQLHIDMMS